MALHFINVLNNYAMKKVWWREGILKFLPRSKVPSDVLELAERFRDKDKLTKTFCSRNKKKLEGLKNDDLTCILAQKLKRLLKTLYRRLLCSTMLFIGRSYPQEQII